MSLCPPCKDVMIQCLANQPAHSHEGPAPLSDSCRGWVVEPTLRQPPRAESTLASFLWHRHNVSSRSWRKKERTQGVTNIETVTDNIVARSANVRIISVAHGTNSVRGRS